MKRILTITVLSLLSTSHSFAQTSKDIEKQVSAFEKEHQACLDEGIDQANCADVFYAQMDSVLNVVYKKLKVQMDVTAFNQLKTEQKQWLVKRDTEFKQFDKDAMEITKELNANAGHADATGRKAFFVEDRIRILLKKLKLKYYFLIANNPKLHR